MDPKDLPPEYVTKLKSVTAKRAKAVIDELLAHGIVTTERLNEMGYNHPPRAIADVRELGIPLTTTRSTGKDGRSMAAYVLADPGSVKGGVLAGRKAFPKDLKVRLIALAGSRCAVCHEEYEDRYLQVDHRIPYRVAGDDANTDPVHFQLMCGSCNRAKSWSCENCPNYEARVPATCATCYWATPHDYEHVATRVERRMTLVWSGLVWCGAGRVRGYARGSGGRRRLT